MSELAGADWLPFRALVQGADQAAESGADPAAGAGAPVMLGHARLTALDAQRPASFSRAVVHDLLRTDWKHHGVLITDDFSMGPVYYSAEGMAGGRVEALNAGVDLLLISHDVDQVYVVMHALMRAERAGRLSGDAPRKSERRLSRHQRNADE